MKTPKNKLRVSRATPLATALSTSLVALFVAALATLPGPAPALSLGMSDTFQAGVQGWTSGDANPSPPVIGAGAGPTGAADRYPQFSASGVQAPGGKLVAIAGRHWPPCQSRRPGPVWDLDWA